MKLLDKETDYYILKETGWDLGFGDIYDKEGNTIGKEDAIYLIQDAKQQLLRSNHFQLH